ASAAAALCTSRTICRGKSPRAGQTQSPDIPAGSPSAAASKCSQTGREPWSASHSARSSASSARKTPDRHAPSHPPETISFQKDSSQASRTLVHQTPLHPSPCRVPSPERLTGTSTEPVADNGCPEQRLLTFIAWISLKCWAFYRRYGGYSDEIATTFVA